MRADYDSEGKSIQIWLEEVDHLDADDVLLGGHVIVSSVGGRPALVEVHWTSTEPVEKALRAAASAHDLDYEALLAAAEAALAAPDRIVTLTVAGRLAVG